VPAKPNNRVRIIGGAWRSRVLRFPAVTDIRPTPDRVRETLFNWLGQDLTGRRCLDLFAGSGALGFEALSRGAAEVVMVERSRTVLGALRENGARLGAGAPRLRFVLGDALHFLDSPGEASFDVVFVDPPYGSRKLDLVVERWRQVPFADVPSYLATGDIGYVVLNATKSNAQATPVKLFEYMAAGLPVIANSDFAVPAEVVRKWRCGLLVPCDPPSIADALTRFAAEPELRREMGERGREAVRREYNWESQAQRLIATYASLGSR